MVEVEGPEDSNILIFCKKKETCNHLITNVHNLSKNNHSQKKLLPQEISCPEKKLVKTLSEIGCINAFDILLICFKLSYLSPTFSFILM